MANHKTPENMMGLYVDYLNIPQEVAAKLVEAEFNKPAKDLTEVNKIARDVANAASPAEVLEVTRKAIEFNKTGELEEVTQQ